MVRAKKQKFGEKANDYVVDLALSELGSSKTACAILANRIAIHKASVDLGRIIEKFLEISVGVPARRAFGEAFRDRHEFAVAPLAGDILTLWISQLNVALSVIESDFLSPKCVFPEDCQIRFIDRLYCLLEWIAVGESRGEGVGLTTVCINIFNSLMRDRRRCVDVANGVEVLIDLPDWMAPSSMFPAMVTDFLQAVLLSDFAVAQQIQISLRVHGRTNLKKLVADSSLQEAAVRDMPILERIIASCLTKCAPGEATGATKPNSDQIIPIATFPDLSEFEVSPVVDCVLDKLFAHFNTFVDRPALSIESTCVIVSAILSEFARLGVVDARFQLIQKKYVTELITTASKRIWGLANIENPHPEEFATNILKAWAQCVNGSSGFISGFVLELIKNEFAREDGPAQSDSQVISYTNYGVCGAIFQLMEGEDTKVDSSLVCGILGILSKRFEIACQPKFLGRFDSPFQIDALVGAVAICVDHLKKSADPTPEIESDMDEGDDEAEVDDEALADMEDDALVEEGLVDMDESSDSDGELDNMDELEDGDEVVSTGDIGELDIDLDEDRFAQMNNPESGDEETSSDEEERDPYVNPEEESSSGEDDDDEDEEDYDEMYDGYDDWEGNDEVYDDVDWEEDDEDDDEEEGGVVIEGDDPYFNQIVEDDQSTYAHDLPYGSPLTGPIVPKEPASMSEATVEFAKQRLNVLLEGVPVVHADEDNNESDDDDDSEDSDNDSLEDQLVGMNGLSLEERLSIQQALGMDAPESEEDDGWVLPPGMFVGPGGPHPFGPQGGSHPFGSQGRQLVVEMPGDMDPRVQARMLAGMINNYNPNVGAGRQSGRPQKRRQGSGEFHIQSTIPSPPEVETLCATLGNTGAEDSLVRISRVCLPVLLRRENFMDKKSCVEYFFYQICLFDQSRKALLEGMFSLLVRFVGNGTVWSVPNDNAVLSQIGLFGRLKEVLQDLNSPAQCRTVGSGRVVNMFVFLLTHVPRVGNWFANSLSVSESMDENNWCLRATPEKRRSVANTPTRHGGNTSSDGEGPLTRTVSARQHSFPTRKVSPVSVLIKMLFTPFVIGSPSHALLILSAVFHTVTTCTNLQISNACVQILCEYLIESKNRLRHMPEFDKAVDKDSEILIALGKLTDMKLVVWQKLANTGSKLVAEMLAKLVLQPIIHCVPLARVFKTARLAFGSEFSDFSSSIIGIETLWNFINERLSIHNNLLLGKPSIAQQRLAASQTSLVESGDNESPTAKIATLETISKLIPLVELFIIATSGPGPALIEFVTRHRRPINSMIKSRPGLLNKAFAPLVEHCPHLLDFDNKRAFFKAKLKSEQGVAPAIKISVRRDDVFRDSYSKLQIRPAAEWRGKLSVSFNGEEGVDAGGLVREWFGILAREIFNPNYALFTPASGRPSTFLINPASCVNPDHIHYYRFCGRFVGKAVFDNQRIDAYFVRSFYKHMLGKEVTWRDMETTDPEYFKNLNWILENDMTDVDYYYFTVEQNEFGKLKVVELMPGGEDIRVTEANKHEYVRLVCEHKLTRGVEEQLKAFLQGFHELIPEAIVGKLFDDRELEMLISGLPSIDIDDLHKHTDYVHYTEESDQIKWFWKALGTFSADELAWFLQFVTGSTQVPLEGFKGLAGMNGPQRFSIHRIKVEDRLPTAHTCFNQLDLPEYPSYDVLETKLKQAVREGHSGFGFI